MKPFSWAREIKDEDGVSVACLLCCRPGGAAMRRRKNPSIQAAYIVGGETQETNQV